MAAVKVLICSGIGINCEIETAKAVEKAGADPVIINFNDLFNEGTPLNQFNLIIFPGGFSYGDELGAGAALASKIRYYKLSDGKTLWDHIIAFLDDGGFLLGICNGFQTLTKLGLLPNLSGKYEQEVSLVENDSKRFENRWCNILVNSGDHFLDSENLMQFPVRHKEGKLVILNDAIRRAIVARGLDFLSYADENGESTSNYPENPNGSKLNCAGLIDESMHIIGLMPHPEAFLTPFNHPFWFDKKDDKPDGLTFFQKLILFISNRL